MVDIITTTWEYWYGYVFGDITIAAIFFFVFLIIWGIRAGWSGTMFITLLMPMIFLIALPMASGGAELPTAWVLTIIGAGLVIGLGISRLFR